MPTLRTGASGLSVAILQQRLNSEGYASLPITDDFGNDTQTAALKVQPAIGLSQCGVIGAAT